MSDLFRLMYLRLWTVAFITLVLITLLVQGVCAADDGSSQEKVRSLVLQAFDARKRGDLPTAVTFMQQASALDPSSADLHIISAAILSTMAKYDEAISEINKGIALEGPANRSLGLLGTIYVEKGDLKASDEAFEKYMQVDPTGEFHFLAREVIDIFKREGASGVGMQAIQAHERGGAQLTQGNYAAAASLFKQACDLEPSVAGFHGNYGFALAELKRNDEAQAEFQKAIDLDKTIPEVWRNIGTMHKLKGEYQIALQDYAEYLRLAPNASDAPVIKMLIDGLRKQVGASP
jgi:tetratricopeptide (TPR) repeat protein